MPKVMHRAKAHNNSEYKEADTYASEGRGMWEDGNDDW